MLPEGELAKQTAQTQVIRWLPTLALPPPCYAEQDLHKTPSKMEGREKGGFVVRGRRSVGTPGVYYQL